MRATMRNAVRIFAAVFISGIIAKNADAVMLGARTIALGEAASAWENPYVSDGLVAMWDGKVSVSVGGYVEDIVSGLKIPASIANERIVYNGLSRAASVDIVGYTIEKCTKINTRASGVKTIISALVSGTVLTSINCRPDDTISDDWLNLTPNYNFIKRGYDFYNATFALVVSGTSTKGYLNYVFSKTTSVAASVIDRFSIGDMNEEIGCIRIYNRALTPAEIQHNYNIDKARFNLP